MSCCMVPGIGINIEKISNFRLVKFHISGKVLYYYILLKLYLKILEEGVLFQRSNSSSV